MKKKKSKQNRLPHVSRKFIKNKPTHVVVKTAINISLQEKNNISQIKKMISKVEKRYFVDVFQFHISKNHIHFFIIAPTKNHLSQSMCYLKSKLAIFFNKKLKRSGTFWVDRFFSSVKASAKEVVRTIHYIAGRIKNISPFDNIYSSL
ncbi:MAG: transposase, partial [Oligoflexia bacterium]|nr:transposase [Oligoflexia bacterium]